LTRTLLLAAALLMPGVAWGQSPGPATPTGRVLMPGAVRTYEYGETVGSGPSTTILNGTTDKGVVANIEPGKVKPPGPPAGPEVPFVIKCYRRDTVPFVLTDKDGNTLFEIRCP
jgi:hypothetical protein